jgi:hypothetical protein
MRCNADPTPSTWDYRGYSANAEEFIHTSVDACSSGTWHITVHQYSNTTPSWFKLTANRSLSSRNFDVWADTKGFVANATQMTQIRTALSRGMKYWFGATKGQHVVEHARLWNTGNCSCGGTPCDVCFENVVGNSACWPQFPSFHLLATIRLGQGGAPWNYKTIAHEWGHCLVDLRDEYDGNGPRCGHSIMGASPASRTNNFCYHEVTASREDHGKDIPQGQTPSPEPPVWDKLNWIGRPVWTPDNTDFAVDEVDGFEFDGWLTVLDQ